MVAAGLMVAAGIKVIPDISLYCSYNVINDDVLQRIWACMHILYAHLVLKELQAYCMCS